ARRGHASTRLRRASRHPRREPRAELPERLVARPAACELVLDPSGEPAARRPGRGAPSDPGRRGEPAAARGRSAHAAAAGRLVPRRALGRPGYRDVGASRLNVGGTARLVAAPDYSRELAAGP